MWWPGGMSTVPPELFATLALHRQFSFEILALRLGQRQLSHRELFASG